MGLGLDLNPDDVHGVSSRMQDSVMTNFKKHKVKKNPIPSYQDENRTEVAHHYFKIQRSTVRIKELLKTEGMFTELGLTYRHRKNEVRHVVVRHF